MNEEIVGASDYQIDLVSRIKFEELRERMRSIEFRGLYSSDGQAIKPYLNADIKLGVVYPPNNMTSQPVLQTGAVEEPLYSPQPTIYRNQSEVIQAVDEFLKKHNLSVNRLTEAVNYSWKGRGNFTILPPIVERHKQSLVNGYLDLKTVNKTLAKKYVKDAKSNLHDLENRYLNDFYIDEVSKLDNMDIFHSNVPLVNYGLKYTGEWSYSIVCDGSHRVDHAIEHLREPLIVIVVEAPSDNNLVPYYALPMPFRPTLRLTSKRAEKMYPRLERDKFHLLNDFLKKTLHYDWTKGDLSVSSLRAKTDIY